MAKDKSKKKNKKKKSKIVWDPWYGKMLDAVSEYIETIADRGDFEFNERDHRIVRALIEFYGFDPNSDFEIILEDVEHNHIYKESDH